MEKNRKDQGDKIRGLFLGLIENEHIHQVQIDNEGLYSVTNGTIANETSVYIMDEYKKHFETIPTTITDALSFVGGNTLSFAKHFSHVNAVEIDATRSSMLKHNLQLAHVLDRVTLYPKTDYLEVMYMLTQDVLFFDPPWGGPDYKYKTHVDLYIGNKNINKIIYELMNSTIPRAKMIVLKAPLNFNKEGLEAYCKKGQCVICFHKRMSKMQLFFIIKDTNVA